MKKNGLTIGRPTKWLIPTLLRCKAGWGRDARPAGFKVSHIYIGIGSPFKKCKPFAVRRRVRGHRAKSRNVRDALGLPDEFSKSRIHAYLPEIAGIHEPRFVH